MNVYTLCLFLFFNVNFPNSDSLSHQVGGVVLLDKRIRIQTSVGLASTNLCFPKVGYGNKYLYFVHAGLLLIKPITHRSEVRLGVAYEPIGYRSDIYLFTNQSSLTRYRLFYGNIHVGYGYHLSKKHQDG